MRIAIKGILVSLAMIGLLEAVSAEAQQSGPIFGQSSIGPEVLAEETEPALPEGEVFEDVFGEGESGLFCEVCGEGNSAPPDWYFEHQLRIFTRSKPREVILTRELHYVQQQQLNEVTGIWVTTFEGVMAETEMTDRTLGFDVSAGYLLTLGRYLGRDTDNRDHFLELSYWGLHSWKETLTYNGFRLPVNFPSTQNSLRKVTIGSLISEFDLPEVNGVQGGNQIGREPYESTIGGFNRADQHTYSYGTDFNTVELNARIRPRSRADRLVMHPNGKWRRECQPGHFISYLFGLRYLSINEAFRWHSEGSIEDPAGGGFSAPVSGDYAIRTHNDLVGLQVGGDYIFRRCKWSWGIKGKAGPFINMADQFSDVTTDTNDGANDPWVVGDDLDIHQNAKKNEASLLAELGFVGTYRIRPNVVLNASYELMWITGLALAPEQLQFQRDPPVGINLNGHVYHHGLSLGFEWRR